MQLRHALPAAPQALFAPPVTHWLVDPQQPPLQPWVPLHVDVHRCVEPSHAALGRQSVAALQPHAPARQTWPVAFWVQSLQTVPAVPQVPAAEPAWQVPFVEAEQHPLLHGCAESQVAAQAPPVHAVSAGQSALVVQAHLPERHR